MPHQSVLYFVISESHLGDYPLVRLFRVAAKDSPADVASLAPASPILVRAV
jgi:hypothetical protein